MAAMAPPGAAPGAAAPAGAPVDVAALMAMDSYRSLNGQMRVVPKTAATGYVSTRFMLAMAPNAGGVPEHYAPVLQYIYSRQAGANRARAAMVAGARAGVFQLANVMTWMLRGNSLGVLLSKGSDLPSCPRDPMGFAALSAEQQASLVFQPLPVAEGDQSAFPNYASTPVHADNRYSLADITRLLRVPVDLRADEVVVVAATTAVDAGVWAEVQTAEVKGLMTSFAECAGSLAFIIAYHLHRADGHHFLTNLTQNPVRPAYQAMLAATKLSEYAEAGEITEVMHDMLHPFAGIARLVHTLMGMREGKGLVSNFAAFRYPFQVVGTSAVVSGGAFADQLGLALQGYNQAVELSWTGKKPAKWAKIVQDVIQRVKDTRDSVARSPHWWMAAANHQVVAQKVDGVRLLCVLLAGVYEGVGLDVARSVAAAPSLATARNANESIFRSGVELGRRYRNLGKAEAVNLEALGLNIAFENAAPPTVAARSSAPGGGAVAAGGAGGGDGGAGGGSGGSGGPPGAPGGGGPAPRAPSGSGGLLGMARGAMRYAGLATPVPEVVPQGGGQAPAPAVPAVGGGAAVQQVEEEEEDDGETPGDEEVVEGPPELGLGEPLPPPPPVL